MSKPDRHKYSGHYVCSLAPCLSDPHGVSTRRARLRVNTSAHKYCIPLIIMPLASPGRRRPRATQGKWGRFLRAVLGWEPRWSVRGAWEFLDPSPGLTSDGACGWRAPEGGAAAESLTPPGALSTCYLATQKATGRIPFGTPGKAFNFIFRHVNIPACPTEGLCFATNYINILFAATQVCSSYPNSFLHLFIVTLYIPLPLVKKKITDVYFIDITYTMVRLRIKCLN